MKIIDARGYECPFPVLIAKDEITNANPDVFQLLVSSYVAVENVTRFVEHNGYSVKVSTQDDYYILLITKTEIRSDTEKQINHMNDSNIVFLITSNYIGNGDFELGQLLMRTLLNTLPKLQMLPTTMIFINSGIFLTTEGSTVIASLQEIERKGVNILVCGTCIDYYKQTNKVLVGHISNMYTILETLMKATKIVHF